MATLARRSRCPGPGHLAPVGTHTLRSTDLGWEPALVGCGTLGEFLDSSELRYLPLKSEDNSPLPPLVGVRLGRENLNRIPVPALAS